MLRKNEANRYEFLVFCEKTTSWVDIVSAVNFGVV